MDTKQAIESLKGDKIKRIEEIDGQLNNLNSQVNSIHEQMNLLNEERINLTGGLSTLEQLDELKLKDNGK